MPFSESEKNWSFGSVTFARYTGGDQYEQWFTVETVMNSEPILDSGIVYTDVGGVDVPDLTITAAFDDAGHRGQILALRGQQHTLSNPQGDSLRCTLKSVQKTFVHNSFYAANLVFRRS